MSGFHTRKMSTNKRTLGVFSRYHPGNKSMGRIGPRTSPYHPLPDLGIATLHVAQGNTWVDGMPTGDAEDLQVCVVAVILVVLYKTRGMIRPGRTRSRVLPSCALFTSSSSRTACCLARRMMASSSWNLRSISWRRVRALCCSRRMRSRSFLPCSSAMQGLCCHCWMRWGRIS